jgi:hypothetical protein
LKALVEDLKKEWNEIKKLLKTHKASNAYLERMKKFDEGFDLE